MGKWTLPWTGCRAEPLPEICFFEDFVANEPKGLQTIFGGTAGSNPIKQVVLTLSHPNEEMWGNQWWSPERISPR